MHFLDPRIDDLSLGRTRRTLAVAVGCLLLALSAAGGLALATWNVADPSLTHATSGPVRNLMGATGAAFADPVMQLLGLAAPILLLPLAVGGIRLARGRRPGFGPTRLLFLIGALALVPAGVAAVPAPGAWPLEIGLGGAVGHAHTVFLEGTLGVRSGFEHALYGALAGGLGVFLLMRALAMPRERPPRARPEAGGIRVRRAHEATRRETAPADVIDDLGEEDPDDRSGRFAALAGAVTHWLLAARARLRPRRRGRPRRTPTVDRPGSTAAEPRRRRADAPAGRERLSGALAAAGPDFDRRAPAGTRVAGDGSGRTSAPASGERAGRPSAPFARRGATAGVVEDPEPWDADASFAAALARRGGEGGRDERVRRDPPREAAAGRAARRPGPDRGSAGDAGRTGSRRPAAPDAAAPAGPSSGRAGRPETAAAGERTGRRTDGAVERRADGSAARRDPPRVDPTAAAPGRAPTLFDVTPATPRPAPGTPAAARPQRGGGDTPGPRTPRPSTGDQKGGGVLTVPTRGPLSLLHRRRTVREAPATGEGDAPAGEDVGAQPSPAPSSRTDGAADRGAPDEGRSVARSDRETIRPAAAAGTVDRDREPDRTRRVDDEADAWLREAAVAEAADSGPRPVRQRAGASAAGPAVRSRPDAADAVATAHHDDAALEDRADGDGARDAIGSDDADEATMEDAGSPRWTVAAEDEDADEPRPARQPLAGTGDDSRGDADRHAPDADHAHGCDADADDAPWDDADSDEDRDAAWDEDDGDAAWDEDDRDESDPGEPAAARWADGEPGDGAGWSGETDDVERAAGHRDDPAGWDQADAWDDADGDDAWDDGDRAGAWHDADRDDAWDDEDWDDSDDDDWPGAGGDDRHAPAEGGRARGDGPPPPPAETTRVVPPAPAMKPGRRIVREAQPSLLSPEEYAFPSLHLLAAPTADSRNDDLSPEALEQNARILEGVLEDFGVRGEIINVRPGPVVTLYELEPAPGIKSARVIGLADDIARSMSAISARVAVIPGKNAIGIELPNQRRITVFLRELMASADFERTKARLPLCLGKTIGGEAVIADLARMPHLLVAGTTGSGKSVSINTMVLSLLYRLRPDQCRLIMIDPKMLELSIYDSIPHLLTPVVTDPKKAVVALKWAVREMEDRYRKMAKLGVRNIDGFNNRLAEARRKGEELTRLVQTGFDHHTGEAIFEEETLDLEPLPYIVILVDEMADLMLVAGKDIEGTIQRLAQMARAAGIHLIMATQRPSVDVITGTIKANFPTRISFQVTSKIDSRTILGEMGAEQLLGMGDMLYMAGGGRIQRVHGPFVSDEEVEDVVAHLKRQGAPDYRAEVTEDDEEDGGSGGSSGESGGGEGEDLYDRAVAIVLRDRKASTSYIQRRLSIGYNRAASLIERMEDEGVVGPANHAGKREILVPSREDEPA